MKRHIQASYNIENTYSFPFIDTKKVKYSPKTTDIN